MSEPAVFRKRLPVRFADVDAARVLYFPRQLHLLHTVMEDFFREAVGIPYAEMIDSDRIGFPTVRLAVDFRSPIRFGDEVDVTLRVREMGKSRVVFAYDVSLAGRADIAASALQTTVAIDPRAWKSVPIPDRYRARLGAFLAPAANEEAPRDGG